MPCVIDNKVCSDSRVVIDRCYRVCWLIQPYARPRIVAAVVFRQKRAHRREFIATCSNGPQRVIQSQHTRLLSGTFAITHLDQRGRYKLRFTTTASGDGCARFICPVADAGPELAGYNWRNKTGAGLLQNGMRGFIQRARFSLVFTTAITSQKRC